MKSGSGKQTGGPQGAAGKQWKSKPKSYMKKEKVPTLRYGQGNFHVFKEALSA
jgi:hypothetical protein